MCPDRMGSRNMNTSEVETVKLRTLRATMHTVEDTVGNALISMRLLLLNSSHCHEADTQMRSRLLAVIDDALGQMNAISSLDAVNEKSFVEGASYLELN